MFHQNWILANISAFNKRTCKKKCNKTGTSPIATVSPFATVSPIATVSVGIVVWLLTIVLALAPKTVLADSLSCKTNLVDQSTGPLYLVDGENLELFVKCNDAVSFQWYYSEAHSNRWIKCKNEEAASDTIHLTYSTQMNEFAFRCQITDTAGKSISSEPVYLRTRDDEVINICDYGAVGDGSTDNTDALLSVFNSAEGKTVFIPEGTFLFSSTLTIPNKCHVYGTGASSILKLADSYSLQRVEWRSISKACMMLLNRDTSGSRLENFTLEGQSANCDDDGIFGIAVMGRDHSITNLTIHDINYFPENWIGGSKGYGSVNAPAWGLAVYKARNVSIFGGNYYNCGYENMGIEESEYVLVDHVNCGIANRVPFQIHRNSEHIILQDSYLHNNENPVKTTGGLTMHGTADNPINYVLIKDCTITGGHIYGVQGGENYITIQNCDIEKTIFTNKKYSSDHDWLITDCRVGGEINLHGDSMIVVD